jgi:hypothetical protein
MTEQHGVNCAKIICEQTQQFGRSQWETVLAIHEHCGVSFLRAHRLAKGWTLIEATGQLRAILQQIGQPYEGLAHQRMSRWETGSDMPSPRYLDALCRLYRTRPDRLGFGSDYTETESGLEDEFPRLSMNHPASKYVQMFERQKNEKEEMERCQLLDSLASYNSGGALSAPLLQTLRAIRTQADLLLGTQSVAVATVDRWESVAHDYGRLQLTTPLYTFLAQIMYDFAEVQCILNRRQPLEFQQRLHRVAAQLAVLIAINVNAVGDRRETDAWFHTAHLAADETGDRALRALITVNEAMSYLWYGRSVKRALELSQTAQVIAGASPSGASAHAAAIEARAQARIGRRHEALAAIRHAETIFERLSPGDIEVNRLSFYEHRLRYCSQNVLTLVGENKAAMTVQQRALELPDADVVDSSLVKLDQAMCLVHSGDLEEGCRLAGQSLLDLPPESRHGVTLFRAREVASMIESTHYRLEPVVDLQEILRLCTLTSKQN